MLNISPIPHRIMSTDNTTKHILIIGGGVAGNALALFLNKASAHPLSKREFTFAIYEAYPRSEKVYIGGGLGLAPNGVAVLASLGLDGQVKKRAGIAKHSLFWSEGGTQLGRWDHDEFGEYMYGMMRSTLYDILQEEMEKKGFKVEYQKRVVKVEECQDQVFVEFADGTTAQGDYLVACDGVRSAVRENVFPDYPKPEFIGLNGAGGFVKEKDIPPNIPSAIKDGMNFIFGKNAFFGIAPASNGGMMWWTNWVLTEAYTPEEIRDTSDVHDRAINLFKDRGMMYPCFELVDATSIYVKQNIFDILTLPSWHKSRICLVGDAAHAVSPNTGQGASLALEDTSLLALLLSRSDSKPEDVFAQFEKLRRKRVEAIVEEGRRQKSNKTRVSSVGMYIRNAFISVFFRLLSADRLIGKAWRYRIDWDEKNIDKVVKWWRGGQLIDS